MSRPEKTDTIHNSVSPPRAIRAAKCGCEKGAGASMETAPLDWLDDGLVRAVKSALLHREAFPDAGEPVSLVRTHISSVLLTPDFVFKFKRPVDVGFADFRLLAARKRFCEAEIALNRRLAPDVYLDVLPLWEAASGYSLNAGSRIVDYCVVMRHLPPEHMMDHRLKHGGLSEAEMVALARLLYRFHQQAPALSRARMAEFGGLQVIRQNWDENFEQTRPFIGRAIGQAVFDEIEASVLAFMDANQALFAARINAGAIRDGHGDLRCEHICLGPPAPAEPEGQPAQIRVIDCIEFNERFRYGDVANDLAFLLMDLCAFGRPDLARSLLRHYTAPGGAAGLVRLIPFYACYRAYVRGKVTSFRLNDDRLGKREMERAADKAEAFFKLALEFSRQMRPPLLLLAAGLMGSGKSTLAGTLSKTLPWKGNLEHLNSDAIRKELSGGLEGKQDAFDEGLYSSEWTRRTYDEMFARAQQALGEGRSVLLDASFASRSQRERAQNLAGENGARAVLLECRLNDEATLRRLTARQSAGGSVSDGRAEIYPLQKKAFEATDEWPAERHLVINTDQPVEALVRELKENPLLRVPPALFGQPDAASKPAPGKK